MPGARTLTSTKNAPDQERTGSGALLVCAADYGVLRLNPARPAKYGQKFGAIGTGTPPLRHVDSGLAEHTLLPDDHRESSLDTPDDGNEVGQAQVWAHAVVDLGSGQRHLRGVQVGLSPT